MKTMTAIELAEWIGEWCATHGQAESKLLTPAPGHYVYTFELFDALSEKLGIDQSIIGERFNSAQEHLEKARAKRLEEARADTRKRSKDWS